VIEMLLFYASYGIAPHALHLLILSHTHACVIGHEEQELEEPEPVEDTNPEQEQGKPRCI
jgi:hypothetical protein